MSWQDYKTRLKNLELEEKIMTGSIFILALSCFMPWYYGAVRVNQTSSFGEFSGLKYVNYSAFGSTAYIIGYLILGIALMAATMIIYRLRTGDYPKLFMEPTKIFLTLSLESILLSTIALFIYTKQAFQYHQSTVMFGLYLSIMAAGSIAIFAYIYEQRLNEKVAKRKAHEFFELNTKENINLEPEVGVEQENVLPNYKTGHNRIRDIYKEAASTVSQEIDQSQINSNLPNDRVEHEVG